MTVTDVDDTTFTPEVLQADRPVLVDCHAAWCGPCKVMAPLVEQLAAAQDQVKVVKLDVDAAPAVARQLGIRGVPTLLLFKNGQPVARRTGALTQHQLLEFAGQ